MSKIEEKFGLGVHVRLMEEHLKEDESIARLSVLIYPLPAGALVLELGEHLQKAAHEFFLSKGLVEEEFTDLTHKGTIQ